ncbi:MAG TPA: pyridoxamine 5'-phosphate oxidase family protein [Candidatus Saccharimonadales bacterium]|nr:pyridoxamine 5'-phosphate oxidase family protein [Candidatus Saccharimonadales bacterium]
MPIPTADRPSIPKEYGIPRSTSGLLDWSHVDRRLTEATVYWLSTSGPGGVPRVRPVDGLWVDGVLYVGGSPATRWARDLATNPLVAVHLDDGTDVAILEGEAELLEHGVGDELAVRLAALSNAKYPQYGMTPESYAGPGPYAIRPHRAFAWTSFPADVTRFRFGD